MSLRHAANRFLRSQIDGWDGSQWVSNVTRGSLLAYDRTLSEEDYGSKLRNLLTDPECPVIHSAIRVGQQVFLAGRQVPDTMGNPYSVTIGLRLVQYVCHVIAMNPVFNASGVKSKVTRASVGTYFCDRENNGSLPSDENRTLKFGEASIYLPAGTPVDNTNEIQIGVDFYKIEEVHDTNGYKRCLCIVNKTSRLDVPFSGNAVANSFLQFDQQTGAYLPHQPNGVA